MMSLLMRHARATYACHRHKIRRGHISLLVTITLYSAQLGAHATPGTKLQVLADPHKLQCKLY